MHDNILGFYLKASEKQDLRDIVRYLFSRVKDQLGTVYVGEFEREYNFYDVYNAKKDEFNFGKFYDFLGSCLYYKKLSFVLFPFRTKGEMTTTLNQYLESESIFACKCWDYTNAYFFFKRPKELEEAYDACKMFLLDDFRLITTGNCTDDISFCRGIHNLE